jgi:hypothetical protein
METLYWRKINQGISVSRFKLLFVSTIFCLLSCENKVSCENQLERPSTYADFEKILNSTNFRFVDELGENKSSWITNCFYYSCDSKTGYFVLHVKDKKYIHSKVPIEYWTYFKTSKSKGSFYNQKIKGNFILRLI